MGGYVLFAVDTLKKHFQSRKDTEPRMNDIHSFSLQIEQPPNLSLVNKSLHCAKTSLSNKILQPLSHPLPGYCQSFTLNVLSHC